MSSTPSLLFRVQQTFTTLLHTPMLPPPAGPAAVEMGVIDENVPLPRKPSDVPSQLQRPARDVRVAEPAFPAPPHFRAAYSPQSYAVSTSAPASPASATPSATSSFEIDQDDAPAVRDMLAAATRDSL